MANFLRSALRILHMKLPKLRFSDYYSLIGLGTLLLQISSNSMQAADPTLSLNFVRSADKTDGNFNRTQTNATTGTWFLSDSTAGAKPGELLWSPALDRLPLGRFLWWHQRQFRERLRSIYQ